MNKAPVNDGSRACRAERLRPAMALGAVLLLFAPGSRAQTPESPAEETPDASEPEGSTGESVTESPEESSRPLEESRGGSEATQPETKPETNPVPPLPAEPLPAEPLPAPPQPQASLWEAATTTHRATAWAPQTVVPIEQEHAPRIELQAELLNLFLYRNDSDFDRSKPIYNENGRTVGAFATVFRPMVTLHAAPNLRLFYEAELGLNYWSRNNPDQENPLAPDIFVLKHRQVFAEGTVADAHVGFKVGYQFFSDPTELFLGHWIGAASTWYALGEDSRVGVFAGQVPDQTYEGILVQENNFKRDIFVFGPRADFALDKDANLSTAVVGLYDSHLVERTRWLLAPAARFELESGGFSGSLDGVLQLGKDQQAALGNADQKIFAWALQAHGTLETHPAVFDANALVLSSDDAKDGNENNGTFLYSSRSRSATKILTEDETRNWYDQIDRRAGTFRGGFWEHRGGLVVADVKGTWIVTRVFRPALILGGAAVLQKNNALNNRFVGIESDLDLELRASDKLSGHLVGGVLFPGKAAAALINRIDREATDPIYMIQGSLLARY